jgi:hypothetical protein
MICQHFRMPSDFGRTCVMTNKLALGLAGIILIALAVDRYVFDWANTLFLGRRLVELIEWLAFWR